MKKQINEDAEVVWQKCLRIIKDNVSIATYKTWFLPIKPLYFEKNVLSLATPSSFILKWLEEHYMTLVKKTVNHILGVKGKIEYVILTQQIASFSLNDQINKRTIVNISSQVNERMMAYFANHPLELKTMDRRLFEEFIAEIFNGFGFKIELTKRTRDGGRDIIAIKNAETKLKYLIECKRPDPGNPVSIKPVRELYGVKQDEKATKAILATTSYFTNDAILFSERNKWELELKDFNGIVKWIHDYKDLQKFI